MTKPILEIDDTILDHPDIDDEKVNVLPVVIFVVTEQQYMELFLEGGNEEEN